jgi:hypothetical protein
MIENYPVSGLRVKISGLARLIADLKSQILKAGFATQVSEPSEDVVFWASIYYDWIDAFPRAARPDEAVWFGGGGR